jgi:uncharacterized membrane protein YbhN (UPF0104 family)
MAERKATTKSARIRRLALVGGTVVYVAIVFVFVLPGIASYGGVWAAVQHLTWPWIVALGVATMLNVVTFAPPWMVVLPGLGFLRALSMTQVSTAFSLVVPGGAPVGMAASFAALRSWGFAGRPVGLAVTLTGIWNQLSAFVFPVVAVGLLAVEGGVSRNLALVAVAGVLLFAGVVAGVAAVLSRPRLAFRAGEAAARLVALLNRLRRKPAPVWGGDALVRFRGETLELLRRRWIALTVATLANQLTGYLMLEFSVRAVGISQSQVSVAECFAAWSVGRLLVSLPLTPGGIGVVELGLTATLIGFGGPHASVVAGVLVYRALSIFPTLLLGLLAAVTWRLQAPNVPAAPPNTQPPPAVGTKVGHRVEQRFDFLP